ncbi:hypothetical protein N9341_05460, partial [Candidatus Pelagibacter sp.]|nr:hypothetical protein [Candidatus Pelagibacter sp.]
MKKIIIKILSLLLVKTRLILLLEKRILNYRSSLYSQESIIPFFGKYTKLDYLLITTLYFNDYFRNLKDKKKQKDIILATLSNGQGLYWANLYYHKGFSHREMRKTIYVETENLIKKKNLDNKDVFFVNLGSCSGLDLLYFKNKFQNINYISSDISEETINFQKNNTFKNIK